MQYSTNTVQDQGDEAETPQEDEVKNSCAAPDEDDDVVTNIQYIMNLLSQSSQDRQPTHYGLMAQTVEVRAHLDYICLFS